MVGEVLSDRYELEELVGTGGMSSVFRAHDRLLDRKVALKVLHQQYTEDAEYVERFRHEARSVASLSHPNVVTVIDRGEHEGRQFIVFEYVDGENLKKLIERGPLPVDQALQLALQIARGLSFAHQQGLVHRDVKPQNVLLNGNGQAKVTDFGIARSLDVKHGMTQTGTVLGTSDYIAPEQAQGQRVDAQTDVYSLGVVLYEMLTSDVPFEGENFVAVAMQHISQPAPHVRAVRPDVPPRVDAAVQRAMAKEPQDRFPSMAAFCQELEACLGDDSQATQGTQVIAPPPRRTVRRRRVSPWPVVLVIAGLLVIGGIVAALILTTGTGVLSIHHSKSPPASSGGNPVTLRAINAYDPEGDGQEHDADAHFATDNNAGTYWRTEDYHSSFAAIGKGGVGLILDAGKSVQLHQIGVVSSTPGFQAVIKAGDSPSGPFDSVVSSPQTGAEQTRFDITGGPHRYYLLWITALPAQNGSVRINEIRAT
ncbi:MAG TPA: protein kinase [Gaiellaceae bacterium]|jgi:serine/threonine-protein kinase|nr:protein kinase [Gaiellaceae bacterium]